MYSQGDFLICQWKLFILCTAALGALETGGASEAGSASEAVAADYFFFILEEEINRSTSKNNDPMGSFGNKFVNGTLLKQINWE
ncbi:hypothetical protein G9A89_007467 [Geosiphon pyriformis]|nr:hypothetical protein G9A89_007467 [Geosiphon pyriformis]